MKTFRRTNSIPTVALLSGALALSFSSPLQVEAESGASRLDKALQKKDFLLDEAHDEFADNSKINFTLPKRKLNQKMLNGIVACLQEPTKYTYGKKGGVFKELLGKYDSTISSVRGGAHLEKPTGCYVGDFTIHYGADYPRVTLPDIGYWAYDLHQFLQLNNGWYKRMNSSRYIKYVDKETFARQWFSRLNKNFSTLTPAAQAVFLHDAIEDGMVVFWFFETHKRQEIFERQTTWLLLEIRETEKRL
ncbi:MAG: hypothetical protein P4L53_03570 [Candidatus Obscuribacterales bacterium]|nr:hypothetical protein [Candidatus Obscuribacterales bacterium]